MTTRHASIRQLRRREAGAALLITMLLLVAMALIGFASLNTVMRNREVAGYSNQGQTALYGADAALSASLDELRKEIVGNALGAGDCLTAGVPTATLPNGVVYGPDSTAGSDDICMLAAMDLCLEDTSFESGQPVFRWTIWNLRTQGQATTGATTRVQATAERCFAFAGGP